MAVYFLKSESCTIIKQLTRRHKKYLSPQEISEQWRTSNTVFLFKEGELDSMKNYCPIAATQGIHESHFEQTRETAGRYQPVEQTDCELRNSFCCMDHIHTVTQLVERAKEYKQESSASSAKQRHSSVWNWTQYGTHYTMQAALVLHHPA
ncbi:hypothetical protein GCK32_013333 [Trichostrongylus colubriformis]|uniref:Uncharacterized protein n=1 Tax=Trichostrongylus colubriformis TaxID=6319 RepID=A0AAN8IXI6_TRICO